MKKEELVSFNGNTQLLENSSDSLFFSVISCTIHRPVVSYPKRVTSGVIVLMDTMTGSKNT